MFWYFKYPLIVIVVIAALGLTSLLWRSCLQTLPQPEKAPEPAPAAVTPPATNTALPAAVPGPGLRPGPAPTAFARVEQFLQKAAQQLASGNLEAARLLALNALKQPEVVEFDRYWFQAADIINEANRRFMNEGAPCAEKVRYIIRAGDNLSKLAGKFYTSVEALQRLNNMPEANPVIHQGRALFYLKGSWSIRVSKQHYLLLLYRDGELYRYYQTGIGRENRTPTGRFVINSRIKHPAWTPPGKRIPYGHPDNVLGTHWLGLTPDSGTDTSLVGYGIHGTWEPETVGTGASAGCVRMRNDDVEELFAFIPEPGGSAPPVKVLIEE
ncbi:MAG: L,D-transpeptidase family protein [Oligosphaeraceae bacterium]|nr:L,D-transpeptidase family protein [Oligosphaeraceae bacterium]